MKITRVIGREIFDGRGWPTIECTLILDEQYKVQASVPAGLSKGSFEAHELRDAQRLMGKGVHAALEQLEKKIMPILLGKEPRVIELDIELLEADDTDEKSVLGANTMLAVSLAVCKAQALEESIELYELIAHLCGFDSIALPLPMFAMFNGGLHANNNLTVQEFLIIPVGAATFRTALEQSIQFYYQLKQILSDHGKSTALGDQGGFATDFNHEDEALEYIMETMEIMRVNYNANFMIGLDMAANSLFNPRTKMYRIHDKQLESGDLIEWYAKLAKYYPIYSIEDGLSQHDSAGWKNLTKKFEKRLYIIGDDIFATNPVRLWEGMQKKIAHSAIIKPNQIGTVTETLQASKLCKEQEMNMIVSHRSGETNDTFISDLAVGISAGHIKAGAPARGEHIAKYNRLITIEDDLLLSDDQ